MKIRTILGILFLVTLVVGSVGVAMADDCCDCPCCDCPCCDGNGNADCDCECTCPDYDWDWDWDGPDQHDK